jgi:hypothetical protein
LIIPALVRYAHQFAPIVSLRKTTLRLIEPNNDQRHSLDTSPA